MANITVSIVLYNQETEEISGLLETISREKNILQWIVVDNGDSDAASKEVERLGGMYIHSEQNLGFGRGHNLAIEHLRRFKAEYHLILNPDISFKENVLGTLIEVMEMHPDVGLVMPKILYPDGSNQYLCKLLPAPLDLVLRRFAPGPMKQLAKNRIQRYELRNFDYERPVYVPSLSGCFMLTRRSVLDAVGGFDDRFFLYMEDVDLCRRMARVSKLLYWPEVNVTHVHEMGSYKSARVLWLHICAAVHYFNKWGWINDPQRKAANEKALLEIMSGLMPSCTTKQVE